jgi:poly-beta-hydroxyalkanoate depolymerase
MAMTRREHLLKQVKEHAEKMRKFQQEFHKNMSNKDEMTSKDLQYMNKVFEQMKLDHEKLLTEYYNYKKPDL